MPIKIHSDSSKDQFGIEVNGNLLSGKFADEMRECQRIAQKEVRAGTIAIGTWLATRVDTTAGELIVLDMDNKEIADSWRKRRSRDSFINAEFRKWLQLSEAHNFELCCIPTFSENQAADAPSRFQFWNKAAELSFNKRFQTY